VKLPERLFFALLPHFAFNVVCFLDFAGQPAQGGQAIQLRTRDASRQRSVGSATPRKTFISFMFLMVNFPIFAPFMVQSSLLERERGFNWTAAFS